MLCLMTWIWDEIGRNSLKRDNTLLVQYFKTATYVNGVIFGTLLLFRLPRDNP